MFLIKDLKIVEKLASGTFGDVLKVQHKETKSIFAIKVERRRNSNSLKKEYLIYKSIPNTANIPMVYTHGYLDSSLIDGFIKPLTEEKSFKKEFLLLSYYEKSIKDISSKFKHNKEALYTAAYFMIEAVQSIHSQNIVHRDIKPGNFMISSDKIILIDFGLAKNISADEEKTCKFFIGTAKYAPLSAHDLIPQGFVDDIEALFYCLLNLYNGGLPWKGLKKNRDEIRKIKKSTPPSELCKENEILLKFYNTFHGKTEVDYLALKWIFRWGLKELGKDVDILTLLKYT